MELYYYKSTSGTVYECEEPVAPYLQGYEVITEEEYEKEMEKVFGKNWRKEFPKPTKK